MKSNYNQGQVILIAVLIIGSAATMLVFGAVTPLVKQIQIARELEASKKSYFLSESSAEDVFYRTKYGISVSTLESLALPGGNANTVTTNVSGGKEIDAAGDIADAVRKVEIKLWSVVDPVTEEVEYGVIHWKETE